MAAKPSTLFINNGCWRDLGYNHSKAHLPTSFGLIPTTCEMRQRKISSQHKKQQAKKVSREPLPTKRSLQSNCDENADIDNDTADCISSSHQMTPTESLQLNGDKSIAVKSDTEDTNREIPITENLQSKDESTEAKNSIEKTDIDNDNAGFVSNSHQMTLTEKFQLNDSEHTAIKSDTEDKYQEIPITESLQSKDECTEVTNSHQEKASSDEVVNSLNVKSTKIADFEDPTIVKETISTGRIDVLETRLAETDARIKVAAQEKMHAEVLGGQLEKLKLELYEKEGKKENTDDMNKILSNHDSNFHTLRSELRLLRNENISLKQDISLMKEEVNNMKASGKSTSEQEDERYNLEAFLKNLESRLLVAQDDVAKLSTLKLECRDLWAKVGSLQELLDKATKEADKAISVLQQNHELRKKVDRLEESLEEVKLYSISSEKLQQYNKLMQQKMALLEERLQRSDEEIHSHVQLYQESVKDFQDMLNNLKEGSRRKALDEPVEDMPWEFWSRILLMIDGWFLERKISSNDANLLGEMTWKRDGRICNAYLACKNKNESERLATFLRLISSATSSGLHIIHIAAEMAPVAKVGGLGDVVSGLAKALQKKGHLVEIVIPKYDCMQYDRISELKALDVVLESYFDGRLFKNKIWVGIVEGLPVYLIEPQHPSKFFWRGQFYGEHDDFKRFSYFSRAALELILQAGKKPDIIHCHDWQTAFVAPLYWEVYASKGLNSARICFTCHNFEYQGSAHASELASCGLDVSQLNRPDRMQDHSARDRVNPVKGAVVFSNIVTTVSPTYAQEVRMAEGGRGLHTTLNSHSKKFIGVLNGIDTDAWDPAIDNFLKVQFNVDDLQGKMENKEELRKHLKLASASPMQPLVGCITRLVPQKGVHLIRHAIYRTMELGGQFVLLGSSPVDHIQREFEGIAKHFQNHPHIRLILKYDEALSHSIYAASDMFIIPSIFEPCGLTQMIAMRYGSVPIVRKTGGLNDSVFDLDDDNVPLHFRNGFTFLSPDEQGVNSALERAFRQYTNNRESWQQLVKRNMKIDFSWDSSASQYIELYEKSVARAKSSKQRA